MSAQRFAGTYSQILSVEAPSLGGNIAPKARPFTTIFGDNDTAKD